MCDTIYIVEWWKNGALSSYRPTIDYRLAMRYAGAIGKRVLVGDGRIRTVDHDRIEIPIRSAYRFLEYGKPVGIVQDDNDNEVMITVWKLTRRKI